MGTLSVFKAMAEFVGLATEGLDKLMSAFQRASSLSPTLTNSNAKALQFLQVAHENVQSMMPLVSKSDRNPDSFRYLWRACVDMIMNLLTAFFRRRLHFLSRFGRLASPSL
jgi:hypothetical protein